MKSMQQPAFTLSVTLKVDLNPFTAWLQDCSIKRMTTWPLYSWESQYLRSIHYSPSAKCTSIIGDSSAHKLCLKLCERISWKTILSHLELQNSFYVKTFQGAQNTAALCGAEWGLCFCRGIYNSVCLVMQQIKVDLHFIINFLFILRTAQATLY